MTRLKDKAMHNHIPCAGNSRALQRLVKLALAHSPWLQYDQHLIKIDWRSFVNALPADDRLMSQSVAQHVELLDQLVPHLDLAMFAIGRQMATANVTMQDNVVTTQSAKILLNKTASAALSALSELVVQERHLLAKERAQASQKTALRTKRYEQETAVERRAKLLAKAETVCGIIGLQQAYTFSFRPAERFLLCDGPIHHILRGKRSTYDYRPLPSPSYRRAGYGLLRRLIHLHLDLLDAMAPVGGGESDTSTDQHVVDIIARMGETEKRLFLHLTHDSQQKNSWRTSLRTDRSFLSVSGDIIYFHQDGREIDEQKMHALCARTRQAYQNVTFNDYDFSQKKSQQSMANSTAALLEQKLPEIKPTLDHGLAVKESPQLVLMDIINLLISRSPLLTLLAGGFLASYITDKPSENGLGICLNPWVMTSFGCQRVTGVVPMTYVGAGQFDEDGGAQEEAVEDSTVTPSQPDDGENNSLGMRLWQRVYC